MALTLYGKATRRARSRVPRDRDRAQRSYPLIRRLDDDLGLPETVARIHKSVCHTLHLTPDTLVQRGREALARGAWEEAHGAFEAALRQTRSPEALEGLGSSCWWLDDGVGVFEAREEAYRLYRERGDRATMRLYVNTTR